MVLWLLHACGRVTRGNICIFANLLSKTPPEEGKDISC
jgi:hypothetical protein